MWMQVYKVIWKSVGQNASDFLPFELFYLVWILNNEYVIFIKIKLWVLFFFIPHPRICSLILERGREKKKHRCERETSISCLPYAPQPGIKPTTKVCALSGDGTHNLLVCETMLQLTEPPGQGLVFSFLIEDVPLKEGVSWLQPL